MTSRAIVGPQLDVAGLRRRMARREAAWRILLAALILYSVAFVAFAIGPFDVGEEARSLISDIVFLPAGIIVALLAWHAARKPGASAPVRRAWLFLGLSFAAFWAGDVIYVGLEFAAQEVPGSSLADVAYLAYYPLALAGLLSFPHLLESRGERLKFALDSLTVALGGALVVWYFVLGPLVSTEHADMLDTLLSMAYPVGDLVLLLGVAAIAIRTPSGVPRPAILLLLGGLVVSLVADVAYGAQAIEGTVEPGRWVDAAYMVAWVLLGSSAYLAATRSSTERPSAQADGDAPNAIPLLPYLSAALGYGMLVAAVRDTWSPTVVGLIIGAGALTALVIVRQVLTVRENMRLVVEVVARRQEARFKSLVQDGSDIIVVVDGDLQIGYASPSAERILGYRGDEMLGIPVLDRVHPDDRHAAARLISGAAGLPGSTATDELRLVRRDGTPLMVDATVHNLLDDPQFLGQVITIRDIDARKRLEVKLAHQAYHDPLTGLPNRSLFMGDVGRALVEGRDAGAEVCVLYIDADDLKTINDSLGHRSGDRALVELARRVRASLATADVLARLAGDEFAVLLDGPIPHDRAEGVCHRILESFAEPFMLDGIEVSLSASIGIAVSLPEHTSEDLLRHASIAMFRAKSHGKSRFATFEVGMQESARERLDLGAALRHGLDRQEFEVHYQPIVDLATSRAVGAEALIRWRRANGDLVLPGRFIALAEETGLIVPIGAWVLDQACLAAAAWLRPTGWRAPSIAVNVSARQLDDLGFPATVRSILERTGLSPARLILEITESMTMTHPELLMERLRALKAVGVQIAIDDFGTGFSSLSYLRRLPVDKVKIDRSFINDLDRAAGSALVRGIVELARSLGHTSVAEGVESAEQAAALAAFGCEFGQGYHFGRPVPAAEIAELLAAPTLPLIASDDRSTLPTAV
jgi:diguanylate cyclase (GGDEF)-like protein/PAS domain S-box-containing protein